MPPLFHSEAISFVRRANFIKKATCRNKSLFLVEEDGFGPSKLKSNRFTVCPLWPLGNSPIFNYKMELADGFEPPTC